MDLRNSAITHNRSFVPIKRRMLGRALLSDTYTLDLIARKTMFAIIIIELKYSRELTNKKDVEQKPNVCNKSILMM